MTKKRPTQRGVKRGWTAWAVWYRHKPYVDDAYDDAPGRLRIYAKKPSDQGEVRRVRIEVMK